LNYSVNLPLGWALAGAGRQDENRIKASRKKTNLKCLKTLEFPVSQLTLTLTVSNKDCSQKRDIYLQNFYNTVPTSSKETVAQEAANSGEDCLATPNNLAVPFTRTTLAEKNLKHFF